MLSAKKPREPLEETRAVRRLYSVGGDAPVNFGRRRSQNNRRRWRRGEIDSYAQVFQPKQPSHSHTLTIQLLCCQFFIRFSAKCSLFPLVASHSQCHWPLHNISKY